MGACIVVTPIIIAAWPAVAAAIAGAASSMGFAVVGDAAASLQKTSRRKNVETEIENSDVVTEGMARGERITISKDDITIEIGRDERGACSVCVTGDKHTEKELKKIGQEVAGRVVQQYAYHKLMTELKKRNYSLVDEKALQDGSIQVKVRL